MTNGTKWETHDNGKSLVHTRQATTGKFIMLQPRGKSAIEWIKFRPRSLPRYNNRKDVLVYRKPHPYKPKFCWYAYRRYGNPFKTRINSYPKLQACKRLCLLWGKEHNMSYKMRELR